MRRRKRRKVRIGIRGREEEEKDEMIRKMKKSRHKRKGGRS